MAIYTPDKYTHKAGTPHSFAVYGQEPLRYLGLPLAGKRILDAGCGNGFWTKQIHDAGAQVIGVDASTQGIELARVHYPGLRFEQLLLTDSILQDLGCEAFDGVISVEVIEHIFDPRGYIRACISAIKPGGSLVFTTPYHGYFKNLALALAGKWNTHLDPLWDGGHVKFWSRSTLGRLMQEAGLLNLQFAAFGRCPGLWMGMVMGGRKPA
jgi:2-polyprenyl-3-methyl-5-hydroxy-6-metoxy-1,4-benzoquinol methylase